MKRLFIVMLCVLFAALGLCVFSSLSICAHVDEAERLRIMSFEALQDGDDERAMELLVALASHWSDCKPLLEIMTSHDDVHEASMHITDAMICLECGDSDDFYRSMAQLSEMLEHICEVETLKLSNVL